MLNHSLSIVFEEYSLQTRPNGTLFWDGWVCRKYSSSTIDNEWFNIYSGMDGSVGNILQAQLTMSGSTYFLGWMGL
jgi:hypothetical protein